MKPVPAILAAMAIGISAAGARPEAVSLSYQINTRHDGVQKFGRAFRPPLKKLWQVDLSGVGNASGVSYPIIINHRAYVTASIGGHRGTELIALDLDTGQVLWRKDIPPGAQQSSNPAYDNGRIFVLDWDGLTEAFSADDGTFLWKHKFDGSVPIFGNPPLAAKGLIFSTGTTLGGTKLHALDQVTGEEKWWQWTSAGIGGVAAPAYDGKALYISYTCATWKFDPLTGAVIWEKYLDGHGGGGKTPVLYDKKLYIRDPACLGGITGGGYMRDVKTGQQAGTFLSLTAPVFWKGKQSEALELVTANETLYALDPKTEAVVWEFHGSGYVELAPIVVDDYVLATAILGNVYLLDVRTGKIRWQTFIEDNYTAAAEDHAAAPLSGMGAGDDTLLLSGAFYLTAFASVHDPRFRHHK